MRRAVKQAERKSAAQTEQQQAEQQQAEQQRRTREVERAFQLKAAFLEQLKASGDPLIIDGGANLGQTSARYLERLPQARIHAFEPFPESFARLRERFQAEPGVTCHALGLDSESGRKTFYLNQHHGTHSLLPRPAGGKRYFMEGAGPMGETELDFVSLDAFAPGFLASGEAIDLLKLDIQGGELRALKGARSLLSSGRIKMVYAEVQFVALYQDAPLYHEVAAFLAGLGYGLLDLFNMERAADGQLRFADGLFLSPEARRMLLG